MEDQDLLRYSRHILLEEFGIDGQARVSVVIVRKDDAGEERVDLQVCRETMSWRGVWSVRDRHCSRHKDGSRRAPEDQRDSFERCPGHPSAQRHDDGGEQQIEMLLHRQRPRVTPHIRTVVLHEQELGQQVPRRQRVAGPEAQEKREDDEHVERRVDLEAAANQETWNIRAPVGEVFAEQQTRHQKPAQNEEQIDAEAAVMSKPVRHPQHSLRRLSWCVWKVPEDDHRDGHGPQQVEVRVSAQLRPAMASNARARDRVEIRSR